VHALFYCKFFLVFFLFNLCFLGMVWDMIYTLFMLFLLHSCFSYNKLSADLCTGRGETTPGLWLSNLYTCLRVFFRVMTNNIWLRTFLNPPSSIIQFPITIHWKSSSAEMFAMQVIFSSPVPLQLALDSRVFVKHVKKSKNLLRLSSIFWSMKACQRCPITRLCFICQTVERCKKRI